jgi:hypothetical protein
MSATVRVLNSSKYDGNVKYLDVWPQYYLVGKLNSAEQSLFGYLFKRKIFPDQALLPEELVHDYKLFWNDRMMQEEVKEMHDFFNSEESSSRLDRLSDFYIN